MWRSRRFDKLVEHQLALFAEDEAELLGEADAAAETWTRAAREETEEAYGDYQLVADAIADRLLEVREGYAGTLDEAAAADYRSTFNRRTARAFRRHGTIASDLGAGEE